MATPVAPLSVAQFKYRFSTSTNTKAYPLGTQVTIKELDDGTGEMTWIDGAGDEQVFTGLIFSGMAAFGLNVGAGYSVYLLLNPFTMSVSANVQKASDDIGGTLVGQWGAEAGGGPTPTPCTDVQPAASAPLRLAAGQQR